MQCWGEGDADTGLCPLYPGRWGQVTLTCMGVEVTWRAQWREKPWMGTVRGTMFGESGEAIPRSCSCSSCQACPSSSPLPLCPKPCGQLLPFPLIIPCPPDPALPQLQHWRWRVCPSHITSPASLCTPPKSCLWRTRLSIPSSTRISVSSSRGTV